MRIGEAPWWSEQQSISERVETGAQKQMNILWRKRSSCTMTLDKELCFSQSSQGCQTLTSNHSQKRVKETELDRYITQCHHKNWKQRICESTEPRRPEAEEEVPYPLPTERAVTSSDYLHLPSLRQRTDCWEYLTQLGLVSLSVSLRKNRRD